MRLGELSDGFAATRDALHQLAFFAIAPARYREEGRMGLTAAPGGFGTPAFEGKVARVEGDVLVLEERDAVASQTITTIRKACGFYGHEYDVDWFTDFHDPLAPVDPDRQLEVDDTAARALGQWFDFGTEALGRLGQHGVEDDDVSEVQLWPEHFDPAIELGDADLGQRASFGASPGDSDHAQPYLYVAPLGEVDRDDTYWNAPGFGGASLGYDDLATAEDAMDTALAFLLRGYRLLHSA